MTNSIEKLKREIEKRKRAEEALKTKVKELEEFHDLAVGRELKMKQMEGGIKELEAQVRGVSNGKGEC